MTDDDRTFLERMAVEPTFTRMLLHEGHPDAIPQVDHRGKIVAWVENDEVFRRRIKASLETK